MFIILASIHAIKNESFLLHWKKYGHREHCCALLSRELIRTTHKNTEMLFELPTCFKKPLKMGKYCCSVMDKWELYYCY